MTITPMLNGDKVLFYVPRKFIPAYEVLSKKYFGLGKDIIDACNNICKSENKSLIACWNTFISACLAHHYGEFKQAAFLHNFVVDQCSLGVAHVEYEPYSRTIIYGAVHTFEPHIVEADPTIIFEDSDSITIDKVGIHRVELDMTKSIIGIALPTGVQVRQISFDEGVLNELYTDTDQIRKQTGYINGELYDIYWYYSPTGAIDDSKITFILQTETYDN